MSNGQASKEAEDENGEEEAKDHEGTAGEDGEEEEEDEVKTHGKRGGIFAGVKSLFGNLLGDIDIIAEFQKAMSTQQIKLPEGVDQDQLMMAVKTSQHAEGLQAAATSLKDNAAKASDPKERQRMLQEAYDREIEANGQSKMARRMQSGAWQGAAGGAGIGGGVGMGLGTVVGTLVGGVVTLPTTALGGLIGAGVGGIHGPFIKFTSDKKKKDGKAEVTTQVPEVAGSSTPAIPPSSGGETADGTEGMPDSASPKPKKKPRKLERRSNPIGNEEVQPAEDELQPGVTRPRPVNPDKPRKKPKKLQVRSANKSGSDG